jgi:TusE/DsrC/DsvC family sulfur relay protein
MAIEVNGKTYETDEEGYLVDLNEWNEDVAKILAEQENVNMTDQHWEVINFLREYYNEFQIAPAVRVLTKAIGKKLGAGEGQQPVPVRAVPLRPGQAGLQDRRPAQADRLRLSNRNAPARRPRERGDPASRMDSRFRGNDVAAGRPTPGQP